MSSARPSFATHGVASLRMKRYSIPGPMETEIATLKAKLPPHAAERETFATNDFGSFWALSAADHAALCEVRVLLGGALCGMVTRCRKWRGLLCVSVVAGACSGSVWMHSAGMIDGLKGPHFPTHWVLGRLPWG